VEKTVSLRKRLHETGFHPPANRSRPLRLGMMEQMIQNGVRERRFRVELYNLADCPRFGIVDIPSGNLLFLCLDEYLLQTAIPPELLGSSHKPIQ